MNDRGKTKTELIEEISCLNQRIRELEQTESEALASEHALIQTLIDSLSCTASESGLSRR